MTTERRTSHPYYMYDAIQGQPDAFASVIARNEVPVDEFAATIAASERLFIVGVGTSHHAALVGEHLMRVYGGGIAAQGCHAFDFALYGTLLTPGDCVVGISHRGNTTYTVASLDRARQAGSRTALIVGTEPAPDTTEADTKFQTVPRERSSAYTISYIGTLAVLSLLAERLGVHRGGISTLSADFLRRGVPQAIRAAIATEDAITNLARQFAWRRRIWLVGGGPSAVTAAETALKIKEASYLQAEGLSAEQILHGPFQCVEAEDIFVFIAPAGAAQERTIQIAFMAREIGAPYIVISDGTPEAIRQDAAGWIVVPAVPEPFTALTCLVPLQLFTYHLALARGTNPDNFRQHDPRFAAARRVARL